MQRNATRRYLLSWFLLACFISSGAKPSGTLATNSPQPAATPAFLSALPAPWNDVDVGIVGVAGSATYSGDSFTVFGSGQRIGGTSDAFNYAYQTAIGDADIEVHINATKISRTAKVGIMMRGDLSAGASFVSMLFSRGSGPSFQFRKLTGGKSKAWSLSGPSNSSWLRLSRSGNSFSGYASSDGINWISVGPISIALGSAPFVGLAVSSGTESALCQGNFDSVIYNSASIGLSSVSVNSVSAVGGSALQGKVTMNGPAPPQGATVSLVSANPSMVSVPSSVTVSGGSTSATFGIHTSPVQASTSARIVASYAATSATALVMLVPNTVVISLHFLSSITISPTSVVGGTAAQGTVALTTAAPSGGASVNLTSDTPSVAAVPSLVTVPAGSTSATFVIATTPVATGATPIITVSWGTVSQSVPITVMPPVVSLLTLNPTSVVGGSPFQGTVTLSGAAPSGGAVISLQSSNTTAATVPISVTVAAGSASASFSATSLAVASTSSVSVSASYGTSSASASLTVSALVLSDLSISPTSVVGGTACQGTVTLGSAAPHGGATVGLSSSNPSAGVPPTVTIQSGTTSATFIVTTSSVSSGANVNITATYNGVHKTAALAVQPVVALAALSVNPTSVTGGTFCQAIVTLGAAAPASGTTVNLTSSNTQAVAVPLTTTVQSGATTSSFTVTTSSVSIGTTVTLTASYSGVNKTATLSVQPVPVSLSALSVNPASLIGGGSSQGAVTLTGAAPSGGMAISISSSNPSVASVPASVSVQPGSSSATFTVATSSVSSTTNVVITATYGSASLTSTLSVQAQSTSATFYVATNGNDSNSGTFSQPFATMRKGVSVLTPGATLLVRGGTYTGPYYNSSGIIPSGSSWNLPVTIKAYPGETVTLTTPHAGDTPPLLFENGEQYIVFENLVLDGTNAGSNCVKVSWQGPGYPTAAHLRWLNCEIKNAPISGFNAISQTGTNTDVQILNCSVHNNGTSPQLDHGIYFSSDGNTVSGCAVYNNAAYGIHIYSNNASNCVINNNRVYANGRAGILIAAGSGHLVYNNLSYNNQWGISVRYGASAYVYNNTCYHNATHGIEMTNDSGSEFDNNLCVDNQQYGIYIEPGTGSTNTFKNNMCSQNVIDQFLANSCPIVMSNNLFGNQYAPNFVNAGANDFHLLAGSSAIDAGLTISTLTFDFDNKPRPQGAGYDIGAYEF